LLITNPSTTSTLNMTEATFKVYIARLIKEVANHPHKDEIIALAYEQHADDTYTVLQD
jgi:hypothetical protein